MKTVAGVPQFAFGELESIEFIVLPEDAVNEKLQQWGSTNNCTTCKGYQRDDVTTWTCRKRHAWFFVKTVDPKDFVCKSQWEAK